MNFSKQMVVHTLENCPLLHSYYFAALVFGHSYLFNILLWHFCFMHFGSPFPHLDPTCQKVCQINSKDLSKLALFLSCFFLFSLNVIVLCAALMLSPETDTYKKKKKTFSRKILQILYFPVQVQVKWRVKKWEGPEPINCSR